MANELDELLEEYAERIVFRRVLTEEERSNKDHIVRANGIDTPFSIRVSNAIPDEFDVVVEAGDPVRIFVRRNAIVSHVVDKTLIVLRQKIRAAIELTPKLHKTLSNLPVLWAESAAMRAESKKWVRSLVPNAYVRKIDDSFFHTTFAVTVRDIVSETEITLTGTNAAALEREAKDRLSAIVKDSDEDIMLRRELLFKPEAQKQVLAETVRIEGEGWPKYDDIETEKFNDLSDKITMRLDYGNT